MWGSVVRSRRKLRDSVSHSAGYSYSEEVFAFHFILINYLIKSYNTTNDVNECQAYIMIQSAYTHLFTAVSSIRAEIIRFLVVLSFPFIEQQY